jgi:hypothetical protein
VESGEERTQRVGVNVDLDLGVLGRGKDLLDRESWEIVLFVEVDEGREFPIYIY